MKRYSVTETMMLRELCIKNEWFTCGSCRQYEKLFYANENGCPLQEIATIIWLCSDEEIRRVDIVDELKAARAVYICYLEDRLDNLEGLHDNPVYERDVAEIREEIRRLREQVKKEAA